MSQSTTSNTKYSIHPLIKKRWSPRSFTSEILSDADFSTLLEAASWAASSMNEQPWKYLWAIRGTMAFDRMVDSLADGNQPWAQKGSHMVISLAKRHFDRNDKINRHHMHDVGAANTTLVLQAAEMGIYGHMMGGFHMDKAIANFGIDSEKWEIACFMVLGKLDVPSALDEPFRSREEAARSRKNISEISQQLH